MTVAAQERSSWDGPYVDPASGFKYWHCPSTGLSTWGRPSSAFEFLACVVGRLQQCSSESTPSESASRPASAKQKQDAASAVLNSPPVRPIARSVAQVALEGIGHPRSAEHLAYHTRASREISPGGRRREESCSARHGSGDAHRPDTPVPRVSSKSAPKLPSLSLPTKDDGHCRSAALDSGRRSATSQRAKLNSGRQASHRSLSALAQEFRADMHAHGAGQLGRAGHALRDADLQCSARHRSHSTGAQCGSTPSSSRTSFGPCSSRASLAAEPGHVIARAASTLSRHILR